MYQQIYIQARISQLSYTLVHNFGSRCCLNTGLTNPGFSIYSVDNECWMLNFFSQEAACTADGFWSTSNDVSK